MEVDLIMIRRSPVPSIIKLIVGIIIASVIYSALHMAMYLTNFFPLASELIEYDMIFFVLYISMIVIITFCIMLRWSCESYEIRSGELIHKKGCFMKTSDSYALEDTENINMTKSVLGRIFQYGNIIVYNPLQKTEIRIPGISDPDLQMQLMKKAIMSSGRNKKIIPVVEPVGVA